jgi:hypothetical protein
MPQGKFFSLVAHLILAYFSSVKQPMFLVAQTPML